MASQPTRTISTRSTNKTAHPGRPDLPAARHPTDVVQAEKAAKVIEDSQRAVAIQAGIQRVACIEHDLAMMVSDQTQRFKKPNLFLPKMASRPLQSEGSSQEADGNLEDEGQAVDEEEMLVNGECYCRLVKINGRLT